MELNLSTADPVDASSQIPAALEPQRTRFSKHKRSFATARVVLALVLREMSSTYGRSPGGYLWAILEPAGVIMILSFGFSLLMRTPSLGHSFVLFYASAYLVFSHFRTIERVVSRAIMFSRPLLLYPAVTWLDAIIARLVLNMLTSLLNMILLFAGILYFTGSGNVLHFPPIIFAVVLASLLGVGIGTLNCMLFGLLPFWTNIWRVVTRPLMIASGVLYTYEDLPAAAGNLLWWNPLIHITGMFRAGAYPYYHPQYISVLYVLIVAVVSLAVGLFFLASYSNDIINQE
jgi:capsular polysaccharide transport system permease protein